MLDFYTIGDDESKPHPGSIPHAKAGGLDLDTFDSLQKKGIIEERFDFYSDFRWGTEMIKQIQVTISKKRLQGDSDVIKLKLLLDFAQSQGKGLVAYVD